MAFESVTEPAAPGLVPYNDEDYTVASHQEHKISILTRNNDKEPLLLLQVEHNSERAKKKPFTPGDVLIFRLLTAMISEKFQALAMEVADGSKKTSTEELT